MVYMDNAATTRVAPEVLEAMLPYFTEYYGNPSTIYQPGNQAKRAIRGARGQIAALIGAQPEEIYFTSGGSESDNWAIKAAAETCADRGRHIITTKIEHHAVIHTCEWLEQQGFQVTYLDVDADGLVDPAAVEAAIRPDTVLISVMTANNEIGTIEPVSEIGRIAHEHGVLFHTDAVQAFGQIPLCVGESNIDLLSASAHKLNGPKGVGCLYIRNNVKLRQLIHGGAQERGRRAGTENVPGIVGFGRAAALAGERMDTKAAAEIQLRDHLVRRLTAEIPDCRLNGHPTMRLPGNVNVSIPGIEGESLLIRLDMEGICASSGSACSSGSLDPSHVLLAIGRTAGEARGSLRLTLSDENTLAEADTVADAVKRISLELRELRR